MSSPAPAFSTAARSAFTAGRDLKAGTCYRCIANGKGEVIDGDTYVLTTNVTDKKGNRQMVNCQTGEILWATPASIWTQ